MPELKYEVTVIENYVDEIIMHTQMVSSSLLNEFQRLQEDQSAELMGKGVMLCWTMTCNPLRNKEHFTQTLLTEVER